MPPEKKFETEAERQAAYRQRKQEQQEQLLRAVVVVADSNAAVQERLEAARLIWRMTRQELPEAAPEVIAMLVNHANVVLTSFAVDPVNVPADWQQEFTAMLAATSAWLLEYKAAHGR